MVILETQNLTRDFGRLRAVQGVNLELRAGELTAIIGPNGAGKTTLFNLLSGRLLPTEGRVRFQGQDITGLPPSAIVRRGLCRTFQITNTFPELTVLENLQVALLSRRGLSWRVFLPRRQQQVLLEEAQRLLEVIQLEDKGHVACGNLSHGDQRHVELGLALASRPSLLLLDEPTAGMAPTETEAMIKFIRRLAKEEEVTIVLTEHDMSVVFAIAERVIVMHHGSIIADGRPDEVRQEPLVKQAYLGE